MELPFHGVHATGLVGAREATEVTASRHVEARQEKLSRRAALPERAHPIAAVGGSLAAATETAAPARRSATAVDVGLPAVQPSVVTRGNARGTRGPAAVDTELEAVPRAVGARALGRTEARHAREAERALLAQTARAGVRGAHVDRPGIGRAGLGGPGVPGSRVTRVDDAPVHGGAHVGHACLGWPSVGGRRQGHDAGGVTTHEARSTLRAAGARSGADVRRPRTASRVRYARRFPSEATALGGVGACDGAATALTARVRRAVGADDAGLEQHSPRAHRLPRLSASRGEQTERRPDER